MEFFTAVSVISISIVSLSGALVALTKLFRGIYHLAKRVEHIYNQVSPNAGSSLRDAIDRIEARVSRLEDDHVQRIHDRLDDSK